MSDKRRKNSKAVASFAFALSIAAAQVTAVSAAAETAPSIDDLMLDSAHTDPVSTGEGLLGAASNYSVFVRLWISNIAQAIK